MHGTFDKRDEPSVIVDASLLGELYLRKLISAAEYLVGTRWRETYLHYLASIGGPDPFGGDPASFTDEVCEALATEVERGQRAMTQVGKRALHAVNAIVVYEEPEELGDFEFTAKAAQQGLAALVVAF